MAASVRWAFNFGKWEPSEQEFLFASSCLQLEEKNRIGKFVFKKDVKASLTGRLLIRKFISECTGLAYNSIHLSKDENEKPIYKNKPGSPKINFNVSHHGSYTVLAGEVGDRCVGVDVMKLEYTGGKTLEEFFRLMNRNFSPSEWRQIKGNPHCTESNQITNFCRTWALKESYVKAIGKGLAIDLSSLNFSFKSNLQIDRVITDTTLSIDCENQPWIFEESLLDLSHCVAVALNHQQCDTNSSLEPTLFTKLDCKNLFETAEKIIPEDLEYCKEYFKKS
ncbi:hypothetical protein QAD02_022971 [Eretmocerus hayati]|uniref:Uncharacterized protein n=1 Tax=Eretmocerus hayati TaxID=131215 RepID=A0ACC2PXW4_9HYME|nr:hypothetical protein QAD02_022971 [Eretmocerus hayati]